MRLIDADAYMEKVCTYKETGCGCCVHQGYCPVDEPTVEAKEVVNGKWRHLGGDEWCCTECGYVISTEGSWEKPKAKFCEECGADMRTSAE